MVDPHTAATFAFAQLQRDPAFRKRFSWLRNTIVCVESDLLAEVINDRMSHYFPDGGSIACYYPAEQRLMFVQAVPKDSPLRRPPAPNDDVLALERPETTIGMVVDYVLHSADFKVSFGEASTAEIEKRLAFS